MARKPAPTYAPIGGAPPAARSPEELAAEGLMSPRQAARFLGVKRSLLVVLAKSGKLKTVKLGKLRQFVVRSLKDYVAGLIREQAR